MAFFNVDTSKCTKDNVCIKVCVANIITTNPDTGYPEIEDKRSKRCIACGHCIAYCPHNACAIESLDIKDFLDIDQESMLQPNEADQFLRSRRSVRHYRKDELPQQTIKELIDVASAAPTGENMQTVSWLVVQERSKMQQISDMMAQILSATPKDDPHAKFNRALVMAYNKGNDVFLRGAPNMAIALTPKDYEWPEDGTISITYMELAAHSRQIGACWAGYFVQMVRENAELQRLVGISDDDYVTGALLLGKPLFKKTKKTPPRKERKIIWT